jgi:hypothetical protein
MLDKLGGFLGSLKKRAGQALETISLYPQILQIRESTIQAINRGRYDCCNKLKQNVRAFREELADKVRGGQMDESIRKGLTDEPYKKAK